MNEQKPTHEWDTLSPEDQYELESINRGEASSSTACLIPYLALLLTFSAILLLAGATLPDGTLHP